MEGWVGGRRSASMHLYAWIYSTCHIMVDSTVWFGRRRPMTWMRPRNKSLFCRKISPKSHFIHLQTRWRGWTSARLVWNAPFTCMVSSGTYNRCSERYITCARNGFQRCKCRQMACFCLKDLHLRSYLTFEMAWRSSLLCRDEWWPVCRGHDIVLMLSAARRLQCVEVWLTRTSVHLPAWSSGLPTTARRGEKSRTTTVNHNCHPLGESMHSCNTLISPVWHQCSPDDQRLQEEASHGCSRQVVWRILSAVSIYKENNSIFCQCPTF